MSGGDVPGVLVTDVWWGCPGPGGSGDGCLVGVSRRGGVWVSPVGDVLWGCVGRSGGGCLVGDVWWGRSGGGGLVGDVSEGPMGDVWWGRP